MRFTYPTTSQPEIQASRWANFHLNAGGNKQVEGVAVPVRAERGLPQTRSRKLKNNPPTLLEITDRPAGR
jgi:hypothetical protein